MSRGGAAPILERRSMASPVPTTRILFPDELPGEGAPVDELLASAETARDSVAETSRPGDRGGAAAADLSARSPGRMPAGSGPRDPVRRGREVVARPRSARDAGLAGPGFRERRGQEDASRSPGHRRRVGIQGGRRGPALRRGIRAHPASSTRAAGRRPQPRDRGGKARVRLLDGLLQVRGRGLGASRGSGAAARPPHGGRRPEGARGGLLRSAGARRRPGRSRSCAGSCSDFETGLQENVAPVRLNANRPRVEASRFEALRERGRLLAVALLRMAARPRSRMAKEEK